MKFRFLGMIAAVALVAACESAPEQKATTTGGGSGTPGAGAKAETAPSVRPGSKEDFIINAGDRVYFDFDKSSLKPEARATLEKQASWLKQYGSVTATVEGHCDERGTREYNLGLGDKRATAAKDYLAGLGVAAGRVKTISYGKERPVALGHNEAAWSQNRRAVTVIN